MEEAARGIGELRRIGEYYGLQMNNTKSNCVMFNVEREIQEIEGVKTSERVKYLGVEIQGKRNLFERRRGEMVSRAKSLSTLTYSVVARSCHKVIVGKSFWKNVVLPRIMFAAEVVNLRKVDKEEIQKQENAAMRRMLEAPGTVAVAGMRGEVGIGTVESRIARSRIQYMRKVQQGDNKMVKRVMEEARTGRSDWMKETRRCLTWAGVEETEVEGMTREEVKRRVAQVVQEEWREEMETKSSLRMYRQFKTEMREEDNGGGRESRLWFEA